MCRPESDPPWEACLETVLGWVCWLMSEVPQLTSKAHVKRSVLVLNQLRLFPSLSYKTKQPAKALETTLVGDPHQGVYRVWGAVQCGVLFLDH